MDEGETVAGFYAPVHRALTEPILLGGAPRVPIPTKPPTRSEMMPPMIPG